jgi:predicted transcriptional regulator
LEERNQPLNEENNEYNSRSGITLNKYQNQIAWRRNKVKELLTRGYAQYEIASLLHISQPTISRDIHYIQKEIRKSAENYSEHLFEIYRNTMLGLDETIKKLWTIIDSPRTDAKERIKAITLIRECYKDRLELIRSEQVCFSKRKVWIPQSFMPVCQAKTNNIYAMLKHQIFYFKEILLIEYMTKSEIIKKV